MIIAVTEELDGTFSADATWLPGSPPVSRGMPSEQEAIKRLFQLIVDESNDRPRNDLTYCLRKGEKYYIERYVRYRGSVVKSAVNEELILGFVPGGEIVSVDVQLGGPVQPPISFEPPMQATVTSRGIWLTICTGAPNTSATTLDSLTRLVNTALTYPPGDLRSLAEEILKDVTS